MLVDGAGNELREVLTKTENVMAKEQTAADGEGYSYPVSVSIKTLLEAGAHYGHQTDRWNPKMLPNIFGERNNVHIINLDETMTRWERARRLIVDTVALGGNILFVGTKPQAREPIQREAARCNGHFITSRWLGGTLSNFQTLKKSIERMRKIEDLLKQANDETSNVKLHKKEKLVMGRLLGKLEANLGGIRSMRKPPELVFIVDVVKESIAVAEAKKLHIPVIALIDTNANPNIVSHPIPSNDDASRTIGLFCAAVADAVIEGRAVFESRIKQDPRQKGSVNEPVPSAAANGETNGHTVTEGQELSAS